MSEIPADLLKALERLDQPMPGADRRDMAPLLTTSGAAIAARDERLARGVSKIIGRIVSGSTGRVQELSFAWRLTSVTSMRGHRRRLVDALQQGLREFDELPSIMSDPDDRRHFGDAMFHVRGDWVPAYISRAIANEKDGEKAREALSRAFVESVPSLARQLQLIAPALTGINFEQQEPSVGRSRRLAAVLDALAGAAWRADGEVEPGDDFGSAVADLVSRVLAHRPSPDRAVRIQAARSVLRFVATAVRLHGPLAGEARSYAFVDPLRRSLGSSNWPDELSADLSKVAGQVLEQLVFLVRLGMPDAELRRIYLAVLGEGVGKLRLSKVADKSVALDAEGARWLRTGTARRVLPTHAAVEETAVSAVDRDLGHALRETEVVRANASAIASDILSAAEFHSARLAEDAKTFFDRTDRMAASVEAASRRRNLILRGTPGEIVPFSPAEHEPVEGAVGARTVRVRTRAVEKMVDGRSMGVIVKSDVEAA